jgi:GNAT superfamily N-acetyltransferase
VEAWRPIYAEYRRLLGDEIVSALGDLERIKREQVSAFIRSTPGDAVIAEIDGRVVGFGTVHLHRPPGGAIVGELGNNAVDAAFAGRGIGARLAEASIAKLIARGAEVLKVFTGMDEGHAPARRLYEKLHFARSLPRIEYYMLARDYQSLKKNATRQPNRA